MTKLTDLMNADREVKAMAQRIDRFARNYERAAQQVRSVLVEAGEIRRDLEDNPDQLGADAVAALDALLSAAEAKLKDEIAELRTRDKVAIQRFLQAIIPTE